MERKNDWGEFPLVILACAGHFQVVDAKTMKNQPKNDAHNSTGCTVQLHLELTIYRYKKQ